MRVKDCRQGILLLAKAKSRRTVRQLLHTSSEHVEATGIDPVIVFDGDRLPAKASEEGTRRQRREEAKQKRTRAVEQGNREERDVYVLRQSLDISPSMALELITALKREGSNLSWLHTRRTRK